MRLVLTISDYQKYFAAHKKLALRQKLVLVSQFLQVVLVSIENINFNEIIDYDNTIFARCTMVVSVALKIVSDSYIFFLFFRVLIYINNKFVITRESMP